MKDTTSKYLPDEQGVSHLIEYFIISSILVLLMIIMILSTKPVFIDTPLNQLTYHAYNDIGNGVSTRIVDLYIIAPEQNLAYENVTINSKFDIPDDVAGRGYYVEVTKGSTSYGSLVISGDIQRTEISLSGIGETISVVGNTSSSGLNEISYHYLV
jgi:hypothetical protein